MASPATSTDLERALQRYGDDLYRVALLLAPDATRAGRALLLATSRLAAADSRGDEPALLRALLAALPARPAGRRLRHMPEWTEPPAQHADHKPLLLAIARLPQAPRLALGLSLLRAFEPAQIAAIIGGDEPAVRTQLRDALLALAPHAALDRAPAIVLIADAPEDCRPTRAALGLADARLRHDPAIRGHLATCSACRAAELAWAQLIATAEEALRGALREARLPATLAAQVQAAARAPQAGTSRHWLANPRVRIALVALPVIAIIAWLVWPRAAPPATSTAAAPVPPAASTAELVRRARDLLYTPVADAAIWHGQYAIQWNFPDNTYALLTADQWLDPAGGRHRLQLVHHTGGGPYEFELADTEGRLWYAGSPNYAAALYPFKTYGDRLRLQINASAEQRAQMLAARLRSGAWSIAEAYLRQAAGAELHAWGRQQDADGHLLQLVSFPGTSPLALPDGAPGAGTITIMLAIDEQTGRLREVRELFGGAGAEQTTRTTWRVLAEESLAAAAGDRIFDQRTAWNGTGTFDEVGLVISAQLPLLVPDQLASPALLLDIAGSALRLPATLPPDADTLYLLNRSPNQPAAGSVPGSLTWIAAGGGRQVAINTSDRDNRLPGFAADERLTIAGARVALKALPGRRYRAILALGDVSALGTPLVSQVSTIGYTRAELIALIESLQPPTLAMFRAQAPLLVEPRPHDAAWQALLGALADPPQPPPGGARHFTEQVFKRQLAQPDPLADPYHRPPYGGWPERFSQENWARTSPLSNTLETVSLTRDAGGTLIARQYRGAAAEWDYDALADRTQRFVGRRVIPIVNEDQAIVLRMLGCGGAQLAEANGQRTLMLTESAGGAGMCLKPEYIGLGRIQRLGAGYATEQTPYLADIDAPITTVITLGADGRPVRIVVIGGAPASGTLLESWERTGEELLAPDQLPADLFSAQPPPARLRALYGSPDALGSVIEPTTQTITTALALARSPLLGFLPGEGQPALVSLDAAPPPEQAIGRIYSLSTDSVFGRMLAEGYLIRAVYTARTSGGLQLVRFYQGAAGEVGAYLRWQAQWLQSAPQTLRIGGRNLPAWQVIDRDSGTAWLLFELDGTLIAVESPTPELLPVLAQLQPIGTAAP